MDVQTLPEDHSPLILLKLSRRSPPRWRIGKEDSQLDEIWEDPRPYLHHHLEDNHQKRDQRGHPSTRRAHQQSSQAELQISDDEKDQPLWRHTRSHQGSYPPEEPSQNKSTTNVTLRQEGAVLWPLLFNIYTSDMPVPEDRSTWLSSQTTPPSKTILIARWWPLRFYRTQQTGLVYWL